jgi:hypothetical protein
MQASACSHRRVIVSPGGAWQRVHSVPCKAAAYERHRFSARGECLLLQRTSRAALISREAHLTRSPRPSEAAWAP